ncbi:MAG: 2-C-methyl-D-erythritol 4-phosphate cytidylyltransferase [Candidatus Rokubacteria bacterium]|nr:2-C-methyl-D-erythritol 4-phosphate cytidylyltransferase [Candidatus Rokubacteria bacterium]
MTTVAIVPAAGSGSRLGRRRPKQFLSVGRAPLVVRTLRVLAGVREVGGIVVAAPPEAVGATRRLLERFRVPRIVAVVPGGRERQESVWLALQVVPASTSLVVVHDAVRPFITGSLVRRVIGAARRHGAASCGVPVVETVKQVHDGKVEATVEREGLWLVQTPQAFHRSLLWEAHEKARSGGFVGTDDAVLVERLGIPVRMVPGLPENFKITTPADLARARTFAARGRR